jgi:hypothetical protein
MMSLIALCPSAWHKAVDPLLADWDSRLANDVERSLVRERGWTIVVGAKTVPRAASQSTPTNKGHAADLPS